MSRTRLTGRKFWSVRRKAIAGLSTCAIAGVSILAASGGAGAAMHDELRPRVYTVTPSSEPGDIKGPSSVKVWDGETHELVKEVPVPTDRADGLAKPHHFMAVPGKNYAFVMGFAPTSEIKVFDMVKNEFTNSVKTGLGPRHLRYAPNGATAYSANFDGDSVSVINLNSQKTMATIPTGDRPNYVEYVKTKNGPRLFASNFGEDTLTVIDAESYKVIDTVKVGNGPFNMAVTHDQRYVISADARSNTATFVDTDTLKAVKQVGIGGEHRTDLPPSAFQRLNPRISHDGKWLWIGNQDASAVSVIDIHEKKLEKLIPAGLGADITFFPSDGPAKGYGFTTNRYDNYVTVTKLNGEEPPTFVGNIPHEKIGSHYMTWDKDWKNAYVSERPGRAYSVFDMTVFDKPNVDQSVLNGVETKNVWVGGVPGPSEPDDSQEYTRAGPDMAVYVFFENGKAHMNSEH
jgi:YVTN family beta-propeller protein